MRQITTVNKRLNNLNITVVPSADSVCTPLASPMLTAQCYLVSISLAN